MKKIISILLVATGLWLGYIGFDKMENSRASLEIGKLEISAEKSESKKQSYLLIGGGALCLIIGAGLFSKK